MGETLKEAGLFLLALVLILAAAVLFTNAIEWLGKRLKLSEGVVGSVLAAVGTALPETIVPVVAIFWMGEVEVGVGAILGAPFMLATLTLPLAAFWIMILSSMGQRENAFRLNPEIPQTDLGYFIPAFTLAILASMIPFLPVKIIVAVVLLGIYFRYLKSILKIEGVSEGEVSPLYFSPSKNPPPYPVIIFQILVSLAIMIGSAHLFVGVVTSVAPLIGISPLILSLLITPVATELPEKFNSLVWVSQKKDNLAVGNITGAMVFQGTIPVSIGIVFTPWSLDLPILVCAGMAVAAAVFYYLVLKRSGSWAPWQIATGILFYLGFGLYIFLK